MGLIKLREALKGFEPFLLDEYKNAKLYHSKNDRVGDEFLAKVTESSRIALKEQYGNLFLKTLESLDYLGGDDSVLINSKGGYQPYVDTNPNDENFVFAKDFEGATLKPNKYYVVFDDNKNVIYLSTIPIFTQKVVTHIYVCGNVEIKLLNSAWTVIYPNGVKTHPIYANDTNIMEKLSENIDCFNKNYKIRYMVDNVVFLDYNKFEKIERFSTPLSLGNFHIMGTIKEGEHYLDMKFLKDSIIIAKNNRIIAIPLQYGNLSAPFFVVDSMRYFLKDIKKKL